MKTTLINLRILLLILTVTLCSYFLINGLTKRFDSIDFHRITNLLILYADNIKIFLFSLLISLFLLYKKINIYKVFFTLYIFLLILFGFFELAIFLLLFILGIPGFYNFFYKERCKFNIDFDKTVFTLCFYILFLSFFVFFPINNSITYFFLLLSPFVFNIKFYLLCLKDLKFPTKLNVFENFKIRKSQSFYDLFIVSLLSLYFFSCLMPEVGYDALATHLFIPSYIDKYKMWHFDIDSYIWAVSPMATELLYTFVYILSDEQSSKFTLFFILLLLILSLNKICNLLNIPNKPLLLLVLSTPLVFLVGSSMFIDLFWSTVLMVIIGLLLSLKKNNYSSINDLILLFFVCALFLNIKLISLIYIFPIIAYLIYITLIKFKNLHKLSKKELILCATLFLWALGPFLISFWHTHNPVFPFFNAIFKSDLVSHTNWNNSLYSSFVDGKILYNITFKSYKYLEGGLGSPGFFWILLFIPVTLNILFRKFDQITLLFLYSISCFLIVFYFQAYLRYVLPSFLIFYIVYVKILYESTLRNNLFDIIFYNLSIILLPLCIFLNLIFFNSATHYGRIQLDSVINKTNLPIQDLREIVLEKYDNHINNRNILLVSEPILAYSPVKPIILNWYNSQAHVEFFKSLENLEKFKSYVKEYNFSLIIYDEAYFLKNINDMPNKNILVDNFTNFTRELEISDNLTLRAVVLDY